MAKDVAWYQVVPTLQSTASAAGASLSNIAASTNHRELGGVRHRCRYSRY